MPLVVPGINNVKDGEGSEDWKNLLMGKKLTDTTSDATNFARRDLPKEHRVVEEGSLLTQDFKPDRLNVHLDKDGKVSHVDWK
ncbi:MAG: hypothetical protein M1826_000052 [Phylliscum demangeonii]|nr:MAG: hypothetical protein M1826_000052 [Phylliscum demangeonii]